MQERILVVEDNLKNVNNAYAALARKGSDVDVAFDLEQASFLMDRNSYSGIITDMTFHEQGISCTETIYCTNDSKHNRGIIPFLRAAQLTKGDPEHIETVIRNYDEILKRDGNQVHKKLVELYTAVLEMDYRTRYQGETYQKFLEALTSVDSNWRAMLKAKYAENWSDWSKPHWTNTTNEFILWCRQHQSPISTLRKMAKELEGSIFVDEEPTYRALSKFQINTNSSIALPVQKAFVEALKRSALTIPRKEGEQTWLDLELVGYTSTAEREKVIRESIENYSTNVHLEQCRLGIVDSRVFDTEVQNIRNHNSLDTGLATEASNPALGYSVVERARKKNIPVISITNARHAAHAIPALIASRLLSLEELRSKKQDNDFLEFAQAIVTYTYEKTIEIYSKGLELVRKAKQLPN